MRPWSSGRSGNRKNTHGRRERKSSWRGAEFCERRLLRVVAAQTQCRTQFCEDSCDAEKGLTKRKIFFDRGRRRVRVCPRERQQELLVRLNLNDRESLVGFFFAILFEFFRLQGRLWDGESVGRRRVRVFSGTSLGTGRVLGDVVFEFFWLQGRLWDERGECWETSCSSFFRDDFGNGESVGSDLAGFRLQGRLWGRREC